MQQVVLAGHGHGCKGMPLILLVVAEIGFCLEKSSRLDASLHCFANVNGIAHVASDALGSD